MKIMKKLNCGGIYYDYGYQVTNPIVLLQLLTIYEVNNGRPLAPIYTERYPY